MPVYQLRKEQKLNITIKEAWEFISNPANLQKITPPYMGFKIVTENLPEKIYPGLIIHYKVSPLLKIKTDWVTEITHVKENEYFVDEQREGPYKLWHHEHLLEEINSKVVMKDIITYKPPFGLLGAAANSLIIKKQLNDIFTFRENALETIFPAKNNS